jgi:hypothetical protein
MAYPPVGHDQHGQRVFNAFKAYLAEKICTGYRRQKDILGKVIVKLRDRRYFDDVQQLEQVAPVFRQGALILRVHLAASVRYHLADNVASAAVV